MPHKLLLADDSVTIQRVIELTFADEDVQVVTVGNGKDAIERVQQDRPDIILADIGMPERNGYEVAAFVKGNPATSHIPVVLLTGAFEPIDEGRAKMVGCDGVLVKPFEPQLVISRVKDLLAGKKPAGMWGGAPAAQGPLRPAAGSDPAAKQPAGPASSDPLEAYFDRLDAAFAGSSASAPAGPAAPAADPFAAVAPPAASKRDAMPAGGRAEPAAPPLSSADPFADWDPDLEGDPSRPAPGPPIAFPQRGAVPGTPTATPAAQPPRQPQAVSAPPAPSAPAALSERAPAEPAAAAPTSSPSLVDAFAALLAAEARTGLKPSAATPAAQTPGQAAAAPITDEVIEDITRRVLARLTDQSRPTILDVAERLVREEIERLKQSGS